MTRSRANPDGTTCPKAVLAEDGVTVLTTAVCLLFVDVLVSQQATPWSFLYAPILAVLGTYFLFQFLSPRLRNRFKFIRVLTTLSLNALHLPREGFGFGGRV